MDLPSFIQAASTTGGPLLVFAYIVYMQGERLGSRLDQVHDRLFALLGEKRKVS